MSLNVASDKLSVKTKLLYGVGDIGNAIVNSAVQFFLLIFYTDAALLAPAAFLFIMGMFASGILTALVIYRKNY